MQDDELAIVVTSALIAICLLWPIVSKLCAVRTRRRNAKLVEGEPLAELQSLLRGRWKVHRNINDFSGPARYRPKNSTKSMPNYTTVVCNPIAMKKMSQGTRRATRRGPAGQMNYILTGPGEKDYRGVMTLREYQNNEGSIEFHKNGSWFRFDGDDKIIFHNRGAHGKLWDGVWERIGSYYRRPIASPEGEHLPSPMASPQVSDAAGLDEYAVKSAQLDQQGARGRPERTQKATVKFALPDNGPNGALPTRDPREKDEAAAEEVGLLSEREEAEIRLIAEQAARDPAMIRDYRAMALKHAGNLEQDAEVYSKLLTDDLIADEIETYTANAERAKRRAAHDSAHPRGRPESYLDTNVSGEYLSLDLAFKLAGGGDRAPIVDPARVHWVPPGRGVGDENVPAQEVDSEAMRRIRAAAARRNVDTSASDGNVARAMQATAFPAFSGGHLDTVREHATAFPAFPGGYLDTGSSRPSFSENLMLETNSGYHSAENISQSGRRYLKISPASLDNSDRQSYTCDNLCGFTGHYDQVVLHEANCNAQDSHRNVAPTKNPPGIGPASPLQAAVDSLAKHVEEANRMRLAIETSCAVLENNGLSVPADLQLELEQAITAAMAAQTALDAAKGAAAHALPTPAYVQPPEFILEGDGAFRPPGMRRTSQV